MSSINVLLLITQFVPDIWSLNTFHYKSILGSKIRIKCNKSASQDIRTLTTGHFTKKI